jgi:hypothetical protein
MSSSEDDEPLLAKKQKLAIGGESAPSNVKKAEASRAVVANDADSSEDDVPLAGRKKPAPAKEGKLSKKASFLSSINHRSQLPASFRPSIAAHQKPPSCRQGAQVRAKA